VLQARLLAVKARGFIGWLQGPLGARWWEQDKRD
jgi:hypothetical protein